MLIIGLYGHSDCGKFATQDMLKKIMETKHE